MPNHGLVGNDSGVSIPNKDKELVERLSENYNVCIATQFIAEKDSFADGALQSSEKIRVLKIGTRALGGSKLKKLYCYVLSLIHFVVALCVKRNTFWYIYFPGYNSVIASCLCALFNRPFALYVRGDWRYSSFFEKPSKYVFAKAKFILTTGIGFKGLIEPLNSNVYPVSPMIAVNGSKCAKRSFSGNDKKTKLLFVGHLSEEKGVYLVLNALAELVGSSASEYSLEIVGGGAEIEVDRLNAEIDRLGVSQYVNYVGHLSNGKELAHRFLGADVFVYPSYFQEGFPRVVYEAMLMELPIVCTILPGMAGFMENESNCLEVVPKDLASLVNAIKKLNNAEMRKNLGEQARSDIVDYLSAFKGATHADQVLDLIEKSA